MIAKLKLALRLLKRRILFDPAKIAHLETQMNNILEFIKVTHSITSVPKADGAIRIMQLASVVFLRRVTEALDAAHLEYFIESGTLLGAVRHKGFIPWDDDIDIGMLREDYVKVCDVLEKSLGPNKCIIVRSSCIRVILKDTPCQIDIFPYDTYKVKSFDETAIKVFKRKYREYEKNHLTYDWSRLHTFSSVIIDKSAEELDALARDFIDYVSEGDVEVLMYGIEVCPMVLYMVPRTCIFPVKPINFEDMQFLAPYDPDKVLTYQYKDYMSFPREIHNHGDISARMTVNAILKMSDVVRNGCI